MPRVGEGDRPAPPRSHDEAPFRLALILFCGSLVVHAALFAFFRNAPEMTASVGEDAITVEIVVGADAAAGVAQARSDVEAEQQSAMAVRQDETTQKKSIQQEPTPQPEAVMTPAEEPIAPPQKEVTPRERSVEETPPEPKPLGLRNRSRCRRLPRHPPPTASGADEWQVTSIIKDSSRRGLPASSGFRRKHAGGASTAVRSSALSSMARAV